nr:acylsugar acyltransferase 3-like [Ipomoea batatas]GMD24941.1 acylsugar acyltransferase 3-like [Ipomoea batatas]GME08953.1 acylsugar acyltransferase 3-like [Ipomoea batatas]
MAIIASPPLSISERLIIKPTSPTPSSLRLHKLSLLDQALTSMYIPLVFFYPNNNHTDPTRVSDILQTSLSRTLTSYYPYAGRLLDNATVECNDAGAEFFRVRVNCTMLEIINCPDADAQNVAFPTGVPWANVYDGGLAVFQLSQFDCGGIAVSAAMCHKVGDGGTVRNFMGHWVAATRHPKLKLSPSFVSDSVFPTLPSGPLDKPMMPSKIEADCVQKRFVFSGEKLDLLNDVVSQSGVKNPTRAEIVSALLYKCCVKAAASPRPSILVHYANMRQPLGLPCNSAGNILSTFSTSPAAGDEMDLARLVAELRDGKERLQSKDNEIVEEIVTSLRTGIKPYENPDLDIYFCSSLGKYPAYTADFGWGWPCKVSMPKGPMKKMFFLIDNLSGGGFEALVMLKKTEMSVFERDEELLRFASPVPISNP